MLSAATVQIEQSDSQPLAAVLRSRIDGDAELRRLRDELKAHLYRGIAWWDTDRQQIAARRLRQLAPGLPPVVQPVALATVAAQLAGDPYYPHAHDVQAAMMSHRYRGRLAAVLVEYFRQLQGGGLVATGRPLRQPDCPDGHSPGALERQRDGGRHADRRRAGRPRRGVHRRRGLVAGTAAALGQPLGDRPLRLAHFDRRCGRRIVATRSTRSSPPRRQRLATSPARRSRPRSAMSPAARAGAGRRAAHEVPTEAELAAAASRAAEASSNPA